jgi:Zn-dependent oligopeptidase
MAELIYGVDPSKPVTPVMVRDAIVDCFIQAHEEILEEMKEYHKFKSEEEFEEMKKVDVKILIKSKFEAIGADFNNPTKKSIIGVMDKLADLSANFRNPEIIKKHYGEIMELVNKL